MKKIVDFNAEDRIDALLLEASTFYLFGEINEESVAKAIKWILYENRKSKEKKILNLYINSSGGELYQAFALIDIIRTSHHIIRTIGVGSVMSSAFLIFASGAGGERYAGKYTSFMIHQFSDTMDAKYHDLKSAIKESDYCNNRMVEILSQASGLTGIKVKKRLLPESDMFFTAEELLEIGIADHTF